MPAGLMMGAPSTAGYYPWKARYHAPSKPGSDDGLVIYGSQNAPSKSIWLVPTWVPPTPEPEE